MMMNSKIFTTANAWTRQFSDIYPDVSSFVEDYNKFSALSILPFKNKESFLEHIFLILMGDYASSTINNLSEDQFRIRFWTRVNQYGPQYEREIEIQKELISLTEEELTRSASVIYNSAINPGDTVEDPSNELIKQLNQQNTTFHKRSKLDAYSYLKTLLDDGKNLTSEFVRKFRDLFMVVLTGPELLYETHLTEE